MNKKLAQLVMTVRQINRQHLQILIAIVVLAMLVLGVGAPAEGGGATRPTFTGTW
jgi:hypothetical protein